MRWLDRWFESRWLGNLSMMLLASGLVLLVRGGCSRRESIPATERPIPSLEGRDFEPQVRSHLDEVRSASGRVLDRNDVSPAQRGVAYGELGRVFVTYMLWNQALPALANATELDRASFQWPYLLAETYRNIPDLPSAVGAMTEALRRMTQDASAKPADQLAAHCFLADVAQKQGHLAEVSTHLEQALKLDPNCVYALFTRGVMASEGDRPEEAIRDLELAAQGQPQSKAIRSALSAAHRRAGHAEEAQRWAVLENSRDRQPIVAPNPLLQGVKGQARSSLLDARAASRLLQAGRYRSALQQLTGALAAAPESVDLALNRTLCLAQLERFPEAWQQWQQLAERVPPTEQARNLGLKVRVELPEERDKALAEAEAWTRDEPDSAQAWQTLAQMGLACGRPAEALAAYERAQALEPEDPLSRLAQTECLGRLGEYDRLSQLLETLWEEFPEDLRVVNRHARWLACGPREDLRNPQRALEMVRPQMETRPSAVLLETMAAALHTLGQTEAAQQAIAKAIEIAGPEAVPPTVRRMRALRQAIEDGTSYIEPWPLADPAKVKAIGKQEPGVRGPNLE